MLPMHMGSETYTVTCKKSTPEESTRISQKKKKRKTGNLLQVWPENQYQFGLSTGLSIKGEARSLFKNLKAEHSTSATIISYRQHQCEWSTHHMTRSC